MGERQDGFLGQRAQSHVNANPIQRAGKHKLLRETITPEEATGGDRSLFLDHKTLAKLLDIARSSELGRVELRCVRLKVQLWQRPGGTTYETWQLLAAQPRPERSPFGG